MGEYMKIEYVDDKIIIYLQGVISDDIEQLAIDIINKMNKYFNIDLKGFYILNAYIDNDYGTIFELELEDKDLYLNFNNIDLHVIRYDNKFVYEIDDILDVNIDRFYVHENKFYIDMDNTENIEFVKIIYKNTDEILKKRVCKYKK